MADTNGKRKSNASQQTQRDDPIDVVLNSLRMRGKTPKSTPSGWTAGCPAHHSETGRDDNLTIGRGNSGGVVLCCQAGCRTVDVVAAIGLEMKNLFAAPARKGRGNAGGSKSLRVPTTAEEAVMGEEPPNPLKPVRESLSRAIPSRLNDGSKNTETWFYENGSGDQVYATARFERTHPDTGETTKSFLAFRRVKVVQDDGEVSYGWQAGHGKSKRPLYRLPKIAGRSFIFVVEGEKSADALVQLGIEGDERIAVTTIAGGSSAVDKADLAPLAGKTVIAILDNDPPGEKHGRLLAKALIPAGSIVVFIRMKDIWEAGNEPSPKDDIVDWIASGCPESWGPHECVEAIKAAARRANHLTLEDVQDHLDDPKKVEPDTRVAVEITTRRDEVVEEVIEVLAGADSNLFARGEILVEVHAERDDDIELANGVKLHQAFGTIRMLQLADDTIGCRITKVCELFTQHEGKEGDVFLKPAHPPNWLIGSVANRKHWRGIRRIDGLAACPYIRADGTISETDGYDPATRTVFRSGRIEAIPDHPTQDDARMAAKTIWAVMRQFPFASTTDFAVWLAGLLTVIQRPAIRGPVPGFAAIANKAGSGKGLSIDVIGIIATGKGVPTSIYPQEKEEATKVRVGFTLGGTTTVHFDNLDDGQAYGSGTLDSSLTSTEPNDRILGSNKTTAGMQLRPCWFLSGNNLVPGKDAHRRWLPYFFKSPLDHPEHRGDITIADLRAYVLENRSRLLAAAMMILRAHALVDRPSPGWPRLGSFEEWNDIVRTAVWYATGLDCCGPQKALAAEAPERKAKLAILDAWKELPEGGTNGNGLTVDDAVKLAEDEQNSEKYAAFRMVLASARKDPDGKPSLKSLGRLISGMQRSNFEGFCFEKVGEKHRSALWRVSLISPDDTSCHTFGEFDEFDEFDLALCVRALEATILDHPGGFRF